MKDKEIEKKISSIIRKVFKLKKKIKSNNLDHKKIKKWDSLGHITLLIVLQEELKIKFDVSDQTKLTNLKSILKFALNKSKPGKLINYGSRNIIKTIGAK